MLQNSTREPYIITQIYSEKIVLKTASKEVAIAKLKELEEKEYEDWLDYYQRCADNYEGYADFIATYYIEYKGKYYDITNYYELERSKNE